MNDQSPQKPQGVPASPYRDIPQKAFWSRTAAKRRAHDTRDFYTPRFTVDKDTARVATAGSCFAQHVGRALNEAGYNVIDTERLPPIIQRPLANKFGYSMYSARYGNVYTAGQMKQLLEEAYDGRKLAEPVWEKDGRFYDAQRPSLDPDGLESPEAVMEARAYHLRRVRMVYNQASVFVFTFGLTECWMDAERTTVYPTAPGTIAGSFDPARHVFHNQRFDEVLNDFIAVRERLKAINPDMRFLVTVSPVPLTATATPHHVEVATSYSKCTLRAAVGELYERFDDLDYFPSYEIVTAQAARGQFYLNNLRSVAPEGVGTAMRTFLAAQSAEAAEAFLASLESDEAAPPQPTPKQSEDDVVCEEMLLESFAKT